MAEPAGGAGRLPRFAKGVARGVHLAILKDALDALDRAEAVGLPFEEGQASTLATVWGGWTAAGAPRLALTTENAAAQAVNLGRLDGLSTPAAVARRPYWLFCAVLDELVTETCFECDGTLLPVGHPWWSTHTAGLHLRCRSSVVACTAAQVAALGGVTSNPPTVEVEDGFGRPGDLCSWEPQPGEYPAELFELIPMRDHTPSLRLADGLKGIDFTPPKGAREEAERGLAWRREHSRGGTSVGIARARDIARGASLSPSTVRRMASYFARHAVDKQGKGWSPGEDGFPSNGRIAWTLWGGDPGLAWVTKVVKQMNARTASEGTARHMGTSPTTTKRKQRRLVRAAAAAATKSKRAQLEAEPVPRGVGLVRRKGLHFRIGLAMNGNHQIEVMHAKAPSDEGTTFTLRTPCGELDIAALSKPWADLAAAEARAAATPADPALTEQLLALRELAAKPVWIQLAKVGSWKGHPAGPFEMTPQTFDEIVRNFRATVNQRIPIDFEHASEAPGDSGSIPAVGAPAQGWITNLDNRGNAGLWGLVEWGDLARAYIQEGKYRFFSPAIRFGSRDRESGKPIGARMTSGALTNIPFLDALVPVTAADRIPTPGATTMSLDRPMLSHDFMARMRAALRCGDAEPMDKLAAKCADLRDLCATMDDAMMSQGVDLKPYMTDLAGLMNLPAHSTLGDILDAVEEMIEAAIQRHEATYHTDGGSDDEPLSSQPTGATMSDASKNTQDLAVTLGETKAALGAITAEKTALLSERDALVTEKASLTLRLKEAESSVAASAAAASAAAAEVVTLKADIAKRDNDALEGTVNVAFETYKDAKKLGDDDKAMMRLTLKSDPALFGRLYPVVAPGERHLLQNLAGGRTPGPRTTQMDGKVPAHAMSITSVTVVESEEDSAKLSNEQVLALTDRLMSEKNMTLKAASIKAGNIASGREKSPFAN